MQLTAQLNEQELKALILEHLQDKLGDVAITAADVKIETKSKQNYKSEWESAAFRATVNKDAA